MNTDWMDNAACGNSKHFLRLPVARQEQICWENCTVVEECRAYGAWSTQRVNEKELANTRTVWGGLTPEQQVVHRRIARNEARRARADAA